MSSDRDRAFRQTARSRVKQMAKVTGPVELPRDLALDDRITQVGFKTKQKRGRVVDEADKTTRDAFNEALKERKREQQDQQLSAKDQKFRIEDTRTHRPNHGHIPDEITGDEFNGMSDVRKAMLLRHAGFQAIEIRVLKNPTIENVGNMMREIPLMQGEVKDEPDATILTYIIDSKFGFYVCYIFPKDGNDMLRFFYACECENIIKG